MDPDKTFQEMQQALHARQYSVARDRAIDLKCWLLKSGFAPSIGYVLAMLAVERVLMETAHITN